jgi:hypothetical protein
MMAAMAGGVEGGVLAQAARSDYLLASDRNDRPGETCAAPEAWPWLP